ncbi:hypothetical protein LX32DRAFT_30933 [Colletotrichum zoysiae]|uniref:Uncharacterized protein n=1 Tax=Colletotrichum zoysiae TaxID=1216348 RepID=A0AAD9HC06_9PEZI|nr:hypothetical protein LX32DRAFT_30933 [Colletotrichum zoysiae]
MSDIRATGIIRKRSDQAEKRHKPRSRPHGRKAFGQAPSIHPRSTFIRYQFAAYADTDCQSLDLLPWPDTVLATQRVAIRPRTHGLLPVISYFFTFIFFWEQERRLYSSRSIAKK